jgi:hypothetical protein
MQFRKNSFSYIAWALYSIAVLNALCFFVVSTAKSLGYGPVYGWLTAALILFICVDVVLMLCMIKESELPFRTPGWLENIGTALVAICFLAFSFFLKIATFSPDYGTGSAYSGWARVGGTVPHFPQGSKDWYVQLLNRVFLLFGNRSVAMYGLQVALELIALVFLFFGIRRLWGNLPALFVLGGWSLMATGSGTSLEPGHSLLYLCVFGLALHLISCVSPAREYSWIIGIFAGILIAVSVYLSALGLILFIPAFCVFWAREEYENLEPHHPVDFARRFGSFASMVFTAILAFFAILYADSVLSGAAFLSVITSYGDLYFTFSGFAYPDLTTLFNGTGAIPVLIALTLGIPVWFRRKGTDIQSIPALMAVSILLLKIFRFRTINEVADPVLFTLIFVLCGCAFSGLLNLKSLKKSEGEAAEKRKKKDKKAKKEKTSEDAVPEELTILDEGKTAAEAQEESTEAQAESVPEEETAPEQEPASVEPASEETSPQEEPAPEEPAPEEPERTPNTEFLAVPLPRKAPKPHKEMDYDIEVSDDDDYDI